MIECRRCKKSYQKGTLLMFCLKCFQDSSVSAFKKYKQQKITLIQNSKLNIHNKIQVQYDKFQKIKLIHRIQSRKKKIISLKSQILQKKQIINQQQARQLNLKNKIESANIQNLTVIIDQFENNCKKMNEQISIVQQQTWEIKRLRIKREQEILKQLMRYLSEKQFRFEDWLQIKEKNLQSIQHTQQQIITTIKLQNFSLNDKFERRELKKQEYGQCIQKLIYEINNIFYLEYVLERVYKLKLPYRLKIEKGRLQISFNKTLFEEEQKKTKYLFNQFPLKQYTKFKHKLNYVYLQMLQINYQYIITKYNHYLLTPPNRIFNTRQLITSFHTPTQTQNKKLFNTHFYYSRLQPQYKQYLSQLQHNAQILKLARQNQLFKQLSSSDDGSYIDQDDDHQFQQI